MKDGSKDLLLTGAGVHHNPFYSFIDADSVHFPVNVIITKSCLFVLQFNFRGIISSCFEPHLTIYVELEEKTLMENLEKLVQVLNLESDIIGILMKVFENI